MGVQGTAGDNTAFTDSIREYITYFVEGVMRKYSNTDAQKKELKAF